MVTDTKTLREGTMLLHDKQRFEINNLKRQNDLLTQQLKESEARNVRLMNEIVGLAIYDRVCGEPPSAVQALEKLLRKEVSS